MTHIARATKPAPALTPAAVDRLADEIAELSSHVDAAMHRLLTLIRRFDEGSGWATHGALSCAHWLSWRTGLDLGAARERVRVARALGGLPLLDDALRRGAISYAKTRALTRVASAETEAMLLEMARHATASQLERICRGYRRARAVQESDRPESLADEELHRFVRTADTDDGMVRVEARLRPEEAALLVQALDVARRLAWQEADGHERAERSASGAATTDVSAETRRHPALSRADALVTIAESFLASVACGRAAWDGGAAPVELVVHVDEAALRVDPDVHAAPDAEDPTPHHATLGDGSAIPLAAAQRLACDAAVVTVARDAAGKVTATSRRTRRISTTLRRALRTRDGGCRFPGCTNRIADAHHLVAWVDGGAATLANLCLLCRRHHRIVHEHGYRIDTGADGELRFFRRDGFAVPSGDVPRRETLDAVAALRGAHASSGLVIDATTAFPRWDGGRVDYALAVQALLAAAAPAATA